MSGNKQSVVIKISVAGDMFIIGLTLLFIGLKLSGMIDWSWWWVLAPLWGSFALLAAVFVGALSYFAIKAWRR
jgi:hypothetical protein